MTARAESLAGQVKLSRRKTTELQGSREEAAAMKAEIAQWHERHLEETEASAVLAAECGEVSKELDRYRKEVAVVKGEHLALCAMHNEQSRDRAEQASELEEGLAVAAAAESA